MRRLKRVLLLSFALGLVLPSFARVLLRRGADTAYYAVPAVVVSEMESDSGFILLRDGDKCVSMPMERYVIGVVLAEMPASFESEALKAQAVAARTFAQKAYVTGGKHGDGSLCTVPGCCQGYITEDSYLRSTSDPDSLLKVRDAVLSTQGMVLTYQGELIEATYFACSGGYTEDAAAVWSGDYPYLTAKKSPGEENAFCYRDEKAFAVETLAQKLSVSFVGGQESWFRDWEYTRGGGVASVRIGGKWFSGTELRKLLQLRSTLFRVEIVGGTVVFRTRGYGHRVGMSQYGADALAVQGKTFEDILTYYYEGTQIVRCDELRG